MARLGTLTIGVDVDPKGTRKGINAVKNEIKGLKIAVATLNVSLIAIAAGKAAFNQISRAINTASAEIRSAVKEAEKLNISVSELTGGRISNELGDSVKELDIGFKNLRRSMVAAFAGLAGGDVSALGVELSAIGRGIEATMKHFRLGTTGALLQGAAAFQREAGGGFDEEQTRLRQQRQTRNLERIIKERKRIREKFDRERDALRGGPVDARFADIKDRAAEGRIRTINLQAQEQARQLQQRFRREDFERNELKRTTEERRGFGSFERINREAAERRAEFGRTERRNEELRKQTEAITQGAKSQVDAIRQRREAQKERIKQTKALERIAARETNEIAGTAIRIGASP